LRGSLVAFTGDSKRILVLQHELHSFYMDYDSPANIFLVFDLDIQEKMHAKVEMNLAVRLETLPDGKTVCIHGALGNPNRHGRRLFQLVKQFVHLDTGKSERELGSVVNGENELYKERKFSQLPPPGDKNLFFGRSAGFLWSDASGLCVQYGVGSFTGNVVGWNLREGRFIRDFAREIDPQSISGFLGGNEILAAPLQNGVMRLSTVNVLTGNTITTAVPFAPTRSLAPDGKSIYTVSTEQKSAKNHSSITRLLELYDLSSSKSFYAIKSEGLRVTTAWSRDAKYLACASEEHPLTVRVVSTADGSVDEIVLPPDAMDAKIPAKARKPWMRFAIHALDLDDSGQWLAVGAGETEFGLVAVVNRKTHRVESVLEGFPISVDAVRFVSAERLLTGTFWGNIQLWDIQHQKSLWTTEVEGQLYKIGYDPGTPYVVCDRNDMTGVVLDLKNGKVHYRTSRSWRGDQRLAGNWLQPRLIDRGKYGLETDSESMQMRLVDIDAGKTVLSFCALPDHQWIIYTPEGNWDGSDHVHDSVKFFEGLKPMSPADAARWKRREPIDAVLKQVFP
jgi:hypothetical protein